MESIVVVADCLEEHAKVDATLRMLKDRQIDRIFVSS